MGNEIRKAKRKLKKSASAVYYHTDPLPPPYHPPITASVTVSVPPPIPPPAPVVGVSVHPPVPVVGVSVPPPMHPPVPVVGFSVPPPMHPPVPVVGVSVPPGPSFMPPALGAVVGMAFAPGQWFPIDLPAVNVGLGWAFKPGDVYDLDTSVTGFDDRGVITESVYYSRKSGFNGAIRLSGDNTTGKGHGDDEVMYITLSRIPHNVRTLAIALNSYKGNSLIRARRAYIRLFEPHSRMEMGRFSVNRAYDCIGLLMGIMHKSRRDGRWYLAVMVEPIPGNVITKSYNELRRIVPGYLSSFCY